MASSGLMGLKSNFSSCDIASRRNRDLAPHKDVMIVELFSDDRGGLISVVINADTCPGRCVLHKGLVDCG